MELSKVKVVIDKYGKFNSIGLRQDTTKFNY